jgi:hypothetical protein
MTDLDTLLAQALALVSEDKRGELADVIEQIITQAQAAENEACAVIGDERIGYWSRRIRATPGDGFTRAMLACEEAGTISMAIRARATPTDPAPKRDYVSGYGSHRHTPSGYAPTAHRSWAGPSRPA